MRRNRGVTGGKTGAGGFAGTLKGGITANCYATGSVTAGADCAGGFAGNIDGSSTVVFQCYSAGDVTCSYDSAGGFAGYSAGVIIHCYYDSETSHRSDTGKGVPLETAAMRSAASYEGWNYEHVWATAGGYPYLRHVQFGAALTPYEKVKPSAALTGEGTKDNPYRIRTEADLLAVGRDLSACYQLEADIAVSDFWTPVGTFAESFAGMLDGNGHRISGVLIREGVAVTDTTDGMGLFGRNNGTVKNLKLEGFTAGGTGSYCGLVAAYNTGTLQDISVKGAVAGGSNSGLLAGYSANAIENCQADGAVIGSKGNNIGGLTGYNNGSVKNCRMTGSVSESGDSNTGYRIGGLTGSNGAKGMIQNCEVNSTVSGRAIVGGAVGSNSGTVENSENESSQVSGTGNIFTQINSAYLYCSLTGGFAGWNGGAIRSCGTESTVRGECSCVGGFVGANEKGIIEDGRAVCGVEQTNANYERCGGFAGSNHATLTRCLAEGTVSGAGTDNGGFVGYSEGFIQYCAATARVTGGRTGTGGFAGKVQGGITANCYATGNVAASANYAGGFAGNVYGSSTAVFQCYSTGSVSCDYTNAGGFAGGNGGVIIHCYYDSETSRRSDTGKGVPLETEAMRSAASYEGWNYEHVWAASGGYPYLRHVQFGAALVPYEKVEPSAALTGEGTKDNPYRIRTEADLLAVGRNLSAYYQLEADIAVSDFWMPLGTLEEPFAGTFDGNGHRISGVLICEGVTVIETTAGMGLFGHNSGVIRNLKVDGVTVGGTGSYRSLAAAYNEGTLQGISVTGTVAGGSYSGLLAGYNTESVENCRADGVVRSSRGNYIGGLLGYNAGALKSSGMEGSVSASGENSTGYYVGGLTGCNAATGIIQECQAKGAVSGNMYVGGLVGLNSGVIENAWNESSRVYGESGYSLKAGAYGSAAGGFAGWNEGTVWRCRTESNVSSGRGCVGGFVGGNNGTVEDSSAKGTVKQTGADNKYCGGFAGYDKGLLARCLAESTVSGAGYDNGGFVGHSEGKIRYCASTGSVAGGKSNTGGFAGIVKGDGSVKNCYSTGNVTSSADCAGGFVGKVEKATAEVSYCYSIGTLSCGYSNIGGFAGAIEANVPFCYYNKETSQQEDTGKGIPVADASMKQQSLYKGWNFVSVWGLSADKNGGYPYLHGIEGDTDEVFVRNISLDKKEIKLGIGKTEKLTVIFDPADTTNQNVIWSSDKTSVATVENGVIKAVASGTATITATTEEGEKTASCTVTVVPIVTGVKLNRSSATMTVRGTLQLTATIEPSNVTNNKITWSSSDPNIATVTDGLVKAVAVGTVIISVTTEEEKKTATCLVTVEAAPKDPDDLWGYIPVTDIKLKYTSLVFFVGDTEWLSATVIPEDATIDTVTWSSSDPSIVTVDSETGLATALQEGSAVITARSNYDSDIFRSCDVTVKAMEGNYLWITKIPDQRYTGSEIRPDIQVYFGEKLLTPGLDYTVSYKNNINAASVSSLKPPAVVVKGRGNYSGTANCKFNINRIPVSEAKLASSNFQREKAYQPVFTYTADDITTVLQAGKDYAILYDGGSTTQPQNAGNHSVCVVGKGNCEGTAYFDFTIGDNGKSIAKAIPKVSSMTYGGSNPTVSLKLDGVNLVLDKDFKVVFSGIGKKGTGKAVFIGIGDYSGMRTASFRVNAARISYGDVSVESPVPYSKGGVKASVSVQVNGQTLVPNVDYTVSYSNNKKYGTAKATVKGKGNYTGTVKNVTFSIVARDLASSEIQIYVSDVQTGKKPTVTIFDTNGAKLKSGSDYKVSVDKYSRTVKITGGSLNPYVTFSPIEKTYREVEKKNLITSVKLKKGYTYFAYSGEPVTLSKDWLEVKIGKKALAPNEFEIVGYANNVKKGTATVIIRAREDSEYGGLKTLNFKISAFSLKNAK